MLLEEYKKYVDEFLGTISNQIKLKIQSLNLSESDLVDIESRYSEYHDDVKKILIESANSEDVKKFLSDIE
jgi:hypothetical protein